MLKYDILICNDDILELPVHVCSTIQEASDWLQCSQRILYKNKHLNGYMSYKGYKLEIVKRDINA